MHWLAHALGIWEGAGYHLLSALIPVLLGSGFFAAWWHKHNCHVKGCLRLQWHPHPVHGFVVCRRHHPAGGHAP